MGVVQLSLLTLGLMVCSYDSALQECLDDQGVMTVLEVRYSITPRWRAYAGDLTCRMPHDARGILVFVKSSLYELRLAYNDMLKVGKDID